MAKKENKSLDSYFQTENEHFNEYVFNLYLECRKGKLFDNKEIPLKLFTESLQLLFENHQMPILAIDKLKKKLSHACKTEAEKECLLKWLKKYLNDSEFDINLDYVNTLLNLEYDKYELTNGSEEPHSFGKLREEMKKIMLTEIKKIPECLEELEAKDRLNILSKFMPFVFPKIQSVHITEGESLW